MNNLECMNEAQLIEVIKIQMSDTLEQNKRIAELENHWISVDDRLPESTGHVLVSCSERVTTALYIRHKNSEGYGRWGTSDGKPRVWMPLPEPPKTEVIL